MRTRFRIRIAFRPAPGKTAFTFLKPLSICLRAIVRAVADAFLAGDLDIVVLSGRIAATARRNGQGRLIAWTSGRRLAATPEVPAVGEYAPGLEALSFRGLVAPARTPAEVVRRLNAATNEPMRDERIR